MDVGPFVISVVEYPVPVTLDAVPFAFGLVHFEDVGLLIRDRGVVAASWNDSFVHSRGSLASAASALVAQLLPADIRVGAYLIHAQRASSVDHR